MGETWSFSGEDPEDFGHWSQCDFHHQRHRWLCHEVFGGGDGCVETEINMECNKNTKKTSHDSIVNWKSTMFVLTFHLAHLQIRRASLIMRHEGVQIDMDQKTQNHNANDANGFTFTNQRAKCKLWKKEILLLASHGSSMLEHPSRSVSPRSSKFHCRESEDFSWQVKCFCLILLSILPKNYEGLCQICQIADSPLWSIGTRNCGFTTKRICGRTLVGQRKVAWNLHRNISRSHWGSHCLQDCAKDVGASDGSHFSFGSVSSCQGQAHVQAWLSCSHSRECENTCPLVVEVRHLQRRVPSTWLGFNEETDILSFSNKNNCDSSIHFNTFHPHMLSL